MSIYTRTERLLASMGALAGGLVGAATATFGLSVLAEATWRSPPPGLLTPAGLLWESVVFFGLPFAIIGVFAIGWPLWSWIERSTPAARAGRIWPSLLAGFAAGLAVLPLAIGGFAWDFDWANFGDPEAWRLSALACVGGGLSGGAITWLSARGLYSSRRRRAQTA